MTFNYFSIYKLSLKTGNKIHIKTWNTKEKNKKGATFNAPLAPNETYVFSHIFPNSEIVRNYVGPFILHLCFI